MCLLLQNSTNSLFVLILLHSWVSLYYSLRVQFMLTAHLYHAQLFFVTRKISKQVFKTLLFSIWLAKGEQYKEPFPSALPLHWWESAITEAIAQRHSHIHSVCGKAAGRWKDDWFVRLALGKGSHHNPAVMRTGNKEQVDLHIWMHCNIKMCMFRWLPFQGVIIPFFFFVSVNKKYPDS